MKIVSFHIKNFKGIKEAKVEIATVAPGNVITLIGLNESGKTTLLEAISNFFSADVDASSIFTSTTSEQRPVDLIPKGLETNFTGEISVDAAIELDDVDIEELSVHLLEKENFVLDKASCPRTLTAQRTYYFKDSNFGDTKNLWAFHFYGFKKGGRKKIKVSYENNKDAWLSAIVFIQFKFPKIVYFPTFLFSIPERIYLQDLPSWGKMDQARIVNRYFKRVLQDVADSLDNNISLDTHIVDRISRHKADVANPMQFLAAFMSTDASSQIKAVTNRLGGKIGRVIFGAWNEISGRSVSGKTVKVDCLVDAEEGNIPYLQISIHDGEYDYAIHERSLGFRWFFAFLLFTQFRASRKSERGTIFLFDEPAANLHARAQIKLLESFGRIASGNKYIVYSTHSHYMIEPLWLEKAFIVENKAVDFSKEDDFELVDTDITVTRYRQFVASNPQRVSYYQPALDALKYSFSPLLPGANAVIVEGKFDFHPLRYFQRRFNCLSFNVIPAPSASEAGTLISLLRGLGTNFVVMLDDDAAGRAAAKTYRSQHMLTEEQVFTLGNLEPSCAGRSFEGLYNNTVADLIRQHPEDTPDKGRFSLLFQELLVSNNFHVELGDTENKVRVIFDGLLKSLGLSLLPKSSKKKIIKN